MQSLTGPPIFHTSNSDGSTMRSNMGSNTGTDMGSTSSLQRIITGPEPEVCYEDFYTQQPMYPKYKRGIAKMLGVIQVTSGVVCMLLNVGMAFINFNNTWHIAAGWWASPFMIFAGTFALSSSKIPNRLTVNATLWLSLISSFLTIAVIVQGTMSLLIGKVCSKECGFSAGIEISHYCMVCFFMIFGIMEFCASTSQFVIGCQVVCIPPPRNPFPDILSPQFGHTNSAFPPPPPPYEGESNTVPENQTSPQPPVPPEGDTSSTQPYLPSYEESVKKQ